MRQFQNLASMLYGIGYLSGGVLYFLLPPYSTPNPVRVYLVEHPYVIGAVLLVIGSALVCAIVFRFACKYAHILSASLLAGWGVSLWVGVFYAPTFHISVLGLLLLVVAGHHLILSNAYNVTIRGEGRHV